MNDGAPVRRTERATICRIGLREWTGPAGFLQCLPTAGRRKFKPLSSACEGATDLVLAYLPDLIHWEVTTLTRLASCLKQAKHVPASGPFVMAPPSLPAASPRCLLPLLGQVSAQPGPSASVAVPHHPVFILQITHCD